MADFDPYLTWLGVPLNQRPPTAYQLLAMDPGITDPAVIKALALQRTAYVRNFQRGEHGELCSKILEEIAQAETLLADSVKRAAYDRSLKPVAPITAPKPAPPKPTPAVAAPPKAKPVSVQAVAVPVEAVPKRRRSRSTRRNSELTMVLAWVGGGVAMLVGVSVLVSVLRSSGSQPTASTVEPAAPKTQEAVTSPQPTAPPSTTPNQLNVLPTAQPSTTAPPQAMTSPSNNTTYPGNLKVIFDAPVQDAYISIDGSPLTHTRSESVYPLPPGEHGVEIMKGRTLRFTTRVMIRPGLTQDCHVLMSAFKVIENESRADALAKRAANLPPHDPEEVVVARYCLEPETTLTLLKGKAVVTKSGRLYEIKARWKEFDEGVEFHLAENAVGRTVIVDPRIVGKECYQVAAARSPSRDLEDARMQKNPDLELRALFHVLNKSATARVVNGKAKVVKGPQSFECTASLAAFDDGVEVEFSSPGCHPLVLRADPGRLGIGSLFVVELVSEKSGKKQPRTKKR